MAKNQGGETEAVDRFLESTLDSVDTAEGMAMDAAGKAGFDEDDVHKIGMAVRECMVNAVVHGNRYNENKKVHFRVAADAERLTIRIVDQGEGFELSDLPDPLAEENLLRHSGRGLFLIRAFMDDLQIQKAAPSGTEVILVKNRGGDQQ
ncbi:MAG: ATP-binding protein [Bryobacteraceae bacterium]